MAFSLRQLQYFVTVAERSSVSSASRALSISQSAVTEALRDLEHDVGFALVERKARGVELTLKGHQFLSHARKILADVADARRALRAEGGQVTGRLHLGVTPLVSGYVLAGLLARYRRAFPDVLLEVTEESTEYLEHLLVGGELDVAAFVLSPVQRMTALQIATIELSQYRAWLPLGHRLADRERVRMTDLAEEAHVLLQLDEIAEGADTMWRRLGLRPTVAFKTTSVEAVRSLVATGAGVAILPDLTFRPWSLEGAKIEARVVDDNLAQLEVVAAWRRGSPLPKPAAGFVELATMRLHR